jgi:hypothetical protein
MLKVLPLVAVLALAGCTSDEYARNEGVTSGAGDAIAADTAMQMVDPWPRGVENTNLRVPADHKQYLPAAKGGGAGAAGSAAGDTITNN